MSADTYPLSSRFSSAYFLTQTALLLLYGQALTVFDRKWTFLFAIFVFEIGSLLCGVAPNVNGRPASVLLGWPTGGDRTDDLSHSPHLRARSSGGRRCWDIR